MATYLKNHLGFQLSEAEFEDIEFPLPELYTHVTLKTLQAGSVLGMLIFGPISGLASSHTRNLQGILRKSARYGRNGAIIGVGVGPLLTYLKARTLTETQVVDRDFRLRHNRGQVRVDQASILGGLTGAGLNIARGVPAGPGCVFGVTAGVLGMAFYNNVVLKK